MKKLYFILFIAPLIASQVFAQPGHWTPRHSGTTQHLLAISAPTLTTAYASGTGGIILKTSDAGYSWIQQYSTTTQDLYSIHFTDALRGYAVGNAGTAVRTVDGGNTWTPMNITNLSLRSVRFVDDTTGYITGGISTSYGMIYKTTNAGISWTLLSVSAPNVIYSTYFTSLSEGYAAEWNGHIYKTTDAGATWNIFSAGYTQSPADFYFTSASNGFTCALGGVISKTNDGGNTWVGGISSGTTDAMADIEFFDSNHGFIVGGNISAGTGRILKTNDGGQTWNNYPITTSRLFRLSFVNSTTGYACGLNGTILKYSSNPVITGTGNGQTGNEIRVYPNPATESVKIETDLALNEECKIELTDLCGRVIACQIIREEGSVTLKRQDTATGIYYLTLHDQQGNIRTAKIIFQ
jgi:photosystem II stability/assembly factor-like uncharacterized protein